VTVAFAAVRALHFASLMSLFGAAALLFQAPEGGAWARRPLAVAALVALVGAIGCLCFAATEITGDAAAFANPRMMAGVVLSTFYGNVFVVRLMLLVALCALGFVERAFGWKAAVAGAALALVSLTSHAAASGDAYWLHAGIDALHLLTAGFWVGGLVVLVREALAAPRDTPRLIGLLRTFSRWGAASVAVLIAAGTANGVFILGAPGMRWSATYITLLAIKVVLAAVMVALALTNRFGVLPGLERGEAEAGGTIALTVTAELVFAGVVLLIVGFLGVVSPMDM
jgi:putative copper resistance protein D